MGSMTDVRSCNRCRAEYPLSEFPTDVTRPRGKAYICRDCSRAKSKTYYENDKEREKAYRAKFVAEHPQAFADYQRKYKYGISRDEYDAMIARQNGRCAVCSDEMKRPHVDHCHATKQVRGLLCGSCNQGLGMFKDDPDRLAQAIRYLEG